MGGQDEGPSSTTNLPLDGRDHSDRWPSVTSGRSILIEFLRAQFNQAATEGIQFTPEGIDKYLETIQKQVEDEKLLDQVAVARLTMQRAAAVAAESDE